MLQPELLNYLTSTLKENQIEYMITGSVVSSLQGEPRATHDIDVVVHIRPSAVAALIRAFPSSRYYLDEESIREAIRRKSMFNLLDTEAGDKVDFWIVTDEPFDISRFKRKIEENVFGFTMHVSSPEDTILAKLRWAKLSGGSEKQFTDALRVYEVQYAQLDHDYLTHWVASLDLAELWERILHEANPL